MIEVIDMNIGLNSQRFPNDPQDLDGRCKDAMIYIRTFMDQNALARVVTKTILYPFGNEQEERTLIVRLSISDMIDFYTLVARLADRLGQDCIAIYCDRVHQGLLLGPRAADWGPFNINYFEVFA